MCHQVGSNGNGSFLSYGLNREIFVGVKRLSVQENELLIQAPAMLTRYKVCKPTNEIFIDTVLVTTEIPIAKQEVNLFIPSERGPYNRTVHLKAGIHLAPILSGSSPFEQYSFNESRTGTNINHPYYPYVLAIFLLDDVLFYDGEDVSVLKFYIPDPWQGARIASKLMKVCGAKGTEQEARIVHLAKATQRIWKLGKKIIKTRENLEKGESYVP